MLLTLVGWLLLILALACLVAAASGRTWSAAGGFDTRSSSGARVNYILAAMFLGILGWWMIDPPEFIARYLHPTAAPGSIDARVAGASTSNSPDASSQPLAMAGGDMSASARTLELEARNDAPTGGPYGGGTPASTGGVGTGATAASPPSAPLASPAGGQPAGADASIVTTGQSGTRWARGDSLLPTGGSAGSDGTGGTSGAFPPPPSYHTTPPPAARDDLGVAATGMSSPPTPGWSNAPASVRARLEGFAPGPGTGTRTAYANPAIGPSAMALPAYPTSGAPTLADIGTTGAGARRGQYTSAAALPATAATSTATPSPDARPGAKSLRATASPATPRATTPVSPLAPPSAFSTAPTRAPIAMAATTPAPDPEVAPTARRPVARRVERRRGWGPRPSSVAPGPLDVALADRLGGDQVLEVLRLTIEGREVARWRIDAESPDLDLAVSLPAPGLLHYVLEGEFLRPDGRVERLHGKGCTAFTQGRRMVVHRTRAGLMSLRQG